MRELSLTIRLPKRRLSAIGTGLALVNVLWLIGTWMFTLYYRGLPGSFDEAPRIKYIWVQANLATENVLAVWYSSMLLLLVALGGLLCFLLDRRRYEATRQRRLNYGWVLFVFIFLTLSIDELGSIHERIGMLPALNPYGDYALGWVYVLALPIALVALYILAFGWLRVRTSPLAFALIVIGVLLFLTVPIHEKTEAAIVRLPADSAPWLKHDIHVLWEEGSELFGALCFFAATALYARKSVALGSGMGGSTVRFGFSLRSAVIGTTSLIVLSALTFAVLAFAVPAMPAGDTGRVENWFPAAASALAGVAFLLLWDRVPKSQRRDRQMYLAGAVLSLAISGYYGGGIYGYLYWGGLATPGRFVHLAMLVPIAALAIALAVKTEERWSRIACAAWAVLLATAFAVGTPYTTALAFAAFGSLALALLAQLARWGTFEGAGAI